MINREFFCTSGILFLPILVFSGCYRIHQAGIDSAKGIPLDTQYRLHSEKPPLLHTVCGNDSGGLWAMGDHGVIFHASLPSFQWQQSESLAATINDCAPTHNGFIAVGSAGTIYARSERGSWVQVPSKSDDSLNAISVLDDEIFVGGDRGTLRVSSDQKTWVARNIRTNSGIVSLTQCRGHVYAATSDGHVWSSANSAKSWDDHPTGLKTANSISCNLSSSVLIVSSSDGHLARSENGGVAWSDIDTKEEVTISSVAWLSDNHWGAVGANGLALESSDDGATWSAFQLDTNSDLTILRKYRNTLVAAGDRGIILKGDGMRTLVPTVGAPYNIIGLIPTRWAGMLAYGYGGDIFQVSTDAPPHKIANIGTLHDIRGASVSDAAHRITVITNFGLIFNSPDGASWSEIHSPLTLHDQRIDLVAIDSSPDARRIAVADSDGNLYVTTDGGGAWRVCTRPGDLKPQTVSLLGDQIIIVAGQHSVQVSMDSGEHWKDFPRLTSENMLAAVHDAKGNVAIVGTNGDFVESSDSGGKWSDPGKDTREQNTLRTVTCLDTCDTMIAAGDSGAAWMVTDHGKGWQALSQAPLDFKDLKWMNGRLWVLLPYGLVRTVTKPGAQWTEGFTDDINSLVQGRGELWNVDGDGELSKSSDRGNTWSTFSLDFSNAVRAISASPDDPGIYLSGDRGLIAYSPDPSDPSHPFQVEAVPPKVTASLKVIKRVRDSVLVGGAGGTILRKANATSGWQSVATPSTSTLDAMVADEEQKSVWAFGESGTILHSPDSGRTWTTQTSPTGSDWNAALYIQGPFGPRILCFGSQGVVAVTDDLGKNWVPRSTSFGDIQSAVFIPSTRDVWAVTSNGILLNSADYGDNWAHTDLSSPGSVNAIIQADSGQTLLIGGDSGFFEPATLIGMLDSVNDIETSITAQDLNISFTVADSKFTHDPDFSLRIARGTAERASGVYQTLSVSAKPDNVPEGRRYTLTASLLGLNPQSGELFWISPCISWSGNSRCLPLQPAEIVPIVNFRAHPKVWGTVAGCLLLVVGQTILLCFAPYYNIRIFLLFRSFEDLVKDKVPFGVWIVRTYRLFLIPLFAFSGRALDAWIRRYGPRIQPSREDWTSYQPLPVDLSVKGKTDHIGQPVPAALAAIADEREITIVGPGGAGKTTLARQITLWLQDDNELTRKIGARPVSLFLGNSAKSVIDSVQALLQDRLGAEVDRELVGALLRKGRLVVVLDGLSERGETAEGYRQELRTTVLARLIITTSRTEHDRVYSSAGVIKPTALNSESLVRLVKSIVSSPVAAETDALEKMSVQLAVATHLAMMVESTQSGVTPLLVETFVKQAERLIAEKRSFDELPRSTAGAYLGYVKELTSRGGPGVSAFKLMKATMHVATMCIDEDFRPCPADYEKILGTLSGEGLGEDDITNLRRLGLLRLLDADIPVRLRFELDPIAEYCAVEYWREHMQAYEWGQVREQAVKKLPSSAGILRAIEDIEKYSAVLAS